MKSSICRRTVGAWALATALGLATPAIAAAPEITPDVVYGHKDGMALVYDVLRPPEANGAAVLFMVSGGWFSRWVPPVERVEWFGHLLDAGFTVIAVHHGSAPRYKVPDAVADVRLAVAHVKANAPSMGIDPARIGVTGGSAGGHLSLMLGLDSAAETRVAAVVAYFPPVDLTNVTGPNERFPALDFPAAEAAAVSPVRFASADDPPVLLIHGDEDGLVPLSASESMHAALQAAGAASELIVIEGAGHGFRGAAQQQARQATVAFFEEHLAAETGE